MPTHDGLEEIGPDHISLRCQSWVYYYRGSIGWSVRNTCQGRSLTDASRDSRLTTTGDLSITSCMREVRSKSCATSIGQIAGPGCEYWTFFTHPEQLGPKMVAPLLTKPDS